MVEKIEEIMYMLIKYCELNNIVIDRQVSNNYAKELLELSYSIGGSSSSQEIEKMIPEFFRIKGFEK